MGRIKVPRIPGGNLKEVYVLSATTAHEFIGQCHSIVGECWPLSDVYTIPSRKNTTITLASSPKLHLPHVDHNQYSKIGKGSFGVGVDYRSSIHGGGGEARGCGRIILDFVCQVINGGDTNMVKDSISKRVIMPNSNIFIYNLLRPNGITLPEGAWDYDIPSGTETELNRQLEPAFEEITNRIESCMKRRGAVLTRGILNSQFVM